jgi:GT2 family glycosyltransferase
MWNEGAREDLDWRREPELRRADGVAGTAMLIRRAVFERIGLLDEDYFFYFEDLDFCLRAGCAGFASRCVRSAVARHQGSRTIGARSPRRLYFAARNHLRLGTLYPLAPPLQWLRQLSIVGINLLGALGAREVGRAQALVAVAEGVRDHVRRRYGRAPA